MPIKIAKNEPKVLWRNLHRTDWLQKQPCYCWLCIGQIWVGWENIWEKHLIHKKDLKVDKERKVKTVRQTYRVSVGNQRVETHQSTEWIRN